MSREQSARRHVAARTLLKAAALGLAASLSALVLAQPGAGSVVYRCPGPPVLYTDAMSAKEANEKGCRTIEGAPITVVQSAKTRAAARANAGETAAPASRASDSRIDPAQQRSRDSDARRILEDELRKAQEQLNALKREYNNGEPERRGDERNYQRYLDRVAELKANIGRKESDIAALKRELGKLPS